MTIKDKFNELGQTKFDIDLPNNFYLCVEGIPKDNKNQISNVLVELHEKDFKTNCNYFIETLGTERIGLNTKLEDLTLDFINELRIYNK